MSGPAPQGLTPQEDVTPGSGNNAPAGHCPPQSARLLLPRDSPTIPWGGYFAGGHTGAHCNCKEGLLISQTWLGSRFRHVFPMWLWINRFTL